MKYLRDAAIAFSMAYVALLPQFYQAYDAANRPALGWQWADSLALYTVLILFGALLYLIRRAVQYITLKGRGGVIVAHAVLTAWNIVLYALILRSALSVYYKSHPESSLFAVIAPGGIKALIYLVLPALVSLFCVKRFQRFFEGIYTALSPAVALLFVLLLTWPGSPDAVISREMADRAPPGSSPDCFIFIFDGWSYEQTFGNGHQPLDNMPVLDELIKKSTFFEQAYSPGIITELSIPRFLFQNEDADWAAYNNLRQTHLKGVEIPGESLFERLDPNNARIKFAAGVYLNYPVMLQGRVDIVQAEPLFIGGVKIGYLGKVQLFLASQLAWWRFIPGLKAACQWMSRPLIKEYVHEKTFRVFAEALKGARGHGVVAYVHFLLPHSPFVWKDGRRSARFRSDLYDVTLENYKNNLLAMDQLAGESIALLKKEGRFGDAVIVFTSDHTWREDPSLQYLSTEKMSQEELKAIDDDKQHRLKHVPLIIKQPRQDTFRKETNAMFTVHLLNWLEN